MKQTAVDKAYSWLRQRILDGTLPGGSFVDEAAVCNATGVSRTPAREAFNRLEGERFITLVHRRGAQVRELNSTDLHDAFNARFMVESFAASEFCANEKPVPEAMHEQLAIMDELVDFTDPEVQMQYLAADHAFHGALVTSLSNRSISEFFDSLWRVNQWGLITRSSWLQAESFVVPNRIQHHALVTKLAVHDAAGATQVLRSHLRVAYTNPLPQHV